MAILEVSKGNRPPTPIKSGIFLGVVADRTSNLVDRNPGIEAIAVVAFVQVVHLISFGANVDARGT